MLVEDRQHGCRVFDARKLIANHKEVVMTTPRHENRRGEAVEIGVNLRWVLANAKFRELTDQQRVPAENIVFVSLHADSLHAAVRGGMVYVPGEQHRRGRFGVSSAVARRYREARGVEPVSFTRDQRLRDEAISRRLAAALLDGYRSEQLPIHDNQPIRASIVRGRRNSRAWLPAVLRGNMVPTKVLLETVNINNSLDAKLLEDPAGRERIARAVVAGLKQHYSREGRPAAATRR
jgi:N-acetylmuramoyl-L-alanine amidase